MNIRSIINEDEQEESIDPAISALSESFNQPKWKQRREAIKISRQARKVQAVSAAMDAETTALAEKNKSSTKTLKRLMTEAALVNVCFVEPHDLDDAPEVEDNIEVGSRSLFADVYNPINANIKQEQAIANELRPQLQNVIETLTAELQAKKRLEVQGMRAREILAQLPNELRQKVLSKMSNIDSSAFVNKNVDESLVSYQAALSRDQALLEEEKSVQIKLDDTARRLTQEIDVLNEGIRLAREFDAIEAQRGQYARKK